MPRVEVRKDEPLEKALRKFKMKMRREGVMDEMKKREFYEKPSQRKRKEKERSRRREIRRQRDEE